MYDKVKAHIQEMLDLGAIRPSNSSWASAILLVRKKDGRHMISPIPYTGLALWLGPIVVLFCLACEWVGYCCVLLVALGNAVRWSSDCLGSYVLS